MGLAGTQVLVVEDEAMIAMMIEDFLVELGCHIAAASDLAEALEKARILAVDIALLDINLAGQLSYPVAQVLQSRGIPFVFATGYNLAELPLDLQGTPILSKPFALGELAIALCTTRAG